MITLFSYLPFISVTCLTFGVIAFLTDYFNWWGW